MKQPPSPLNLKIVKVLSGVHFEAETIKGIEYALFTAVDGQYEANFAPQVHSNAP